MIVTSMILINFSMINGGIFKLRDQDRLKREIGSGLNDGKGYLIVDLGCYFPYTNVEVLTFDFAIDSNTYDDKVTNTRYPNKCYQTISKKKGRQISRFGYPVEFEYGEHTVKLAITIGIEDDTATLVFPLVFRLDKDHPIAGLSFRYNFDNHEFYLMSHAKVPDMPGWWDYRWYNTNNEHINDQHYKLLSEPEQTDTVLTYKDVIFPKPNSLEDFIQI